MSHDGTEISVPAGQGALAKKFRSSEIADGTVVINVWRKDSDNDYAAQLPPVQLKAFWDFCVQVYGKEELTKILTGEEP